MFQARIPFTRHNQYNPALLTSSSTFVYNLCHILYTKQNSAVMEMCKEGSELPEVNLEVFTANNSSGGKVDL